MPVARLLPDPDVGCWAVRSSNCRFRFTQTYGFLRPRRLDDVLNGRPARSLAPYR